MGLPELRGSRLALLPAARHAANAPYSDAIDLTRRVEEQG